MQMVLECFNHTLENFFKYIRQGVQSWIACKQKKGKILFQRMSEQSMNNSMYMVTLL